MIQENKELLLKDLCARLPYGVKYQCSDIKNIWKLNAILTKRRDDGVLLDIYNPLELCKPYLFPLSSMTEKQTHEFLSTCNCYCEYYWTEETFDWLNAHHFDYRNLIDKSLALDATGLNIY